MRGKALELNGASDLIGITPAYAGKSGLRSKVERNDGDHPRLCGEKEKIVRLLPSKWGSPPPMRGKARSSPARYF